MFEKIKENKFLKILWNIIYTFLFVFVVLILAVVVMQRFSNNKTSLGGFRIYNIITESMVPVYNVGDVILDKEVDASELKKGDDITYTGTKGNFAGRVVTHRIESIEKNDDGSYTIVTKGVANSMSDPEITENEVQGKVIYRFVVISFLSKLINNDLKTMYILIFIPIAVIIFINIMNFTNKDKGTKEDE